ncbi:MAG TPA: MFS transporter [Thermomicrobiales bacterium]|jgi:MFS family permease
MRSRITPESVSGVNRVPLAALYTANAVSVVGNFMTLVAVPQMLAGFFANSLVDRLGYRRASIVADLAAGSTVALVPLLYHSHLLAFWQLVLLVFCGNLLNTPGTTARQIFVREEYGTPLALGLLRGGWGAGLLIGSLVYSLVADRLPRRKTYMLSYALGAALFALFLFVPPLPVAVAAMALSAAAVSPALPLRLTIQQERTPEALRSRVFGTSNAMLFSAAPIGIALFSVMAQGYGVMFTITTSWLIWVGIAVAVAVSPAFRLMDGTPARAARALRTLPARLENEESLAEATA